MLNRHSEDERLDAMLSACIAGVQMNFRHLPIRFIIDPPKHTTDALLARNVANHIMARIFGAPMQRIALMTGVSRCSVSNGLDVVDRRLEEPVFEAAYRRMSRRAAALYDLRLTEAA